MKVLLSLREVPKAGYLFNFARQPDKIDSAKPSLTDTQEFVTVSEKLF